MGLAARFYLFSDDGLQRISHRLMNGLARGKDAIPQYAGTKQKISSCRDRKWKADASR
jgi:hypothetical protein